MKRNKPRSRGGFTLVEMVASTLCAAIVVGAVLLSLISVGKTQFLLKDSMSSRQSARIALTAIERMIRNGEIKTVRTYIDGKSWSFVLENGQRVLAYNAGENALTTAAGEKILEDVSCEANPSVSPSRHELTFRLGVGEYSYETTVYSRITEMNVESVNYALYGDPATEPDPDPEPDSPDASAEPLSVSALPAVERAGRNDFLEVLLGQYGSAGEIVGGDGYYSEWYLGGSYAFSPEWNEDTPWCACFLSWGLAQLPADALAETPRFADVDEGVEWFRDRAAFLPPEAAPLPGDLVFFDWDADGDPDHVGAVLSAGADGLTTLEGNRNNAVTSAAYRPGDPAILGYGRLAWRGA